MGLSTSEMFSLLFTRVGPLCHAAWITTSNVGARFAIQRQSNNKSIASVDYDDFRLAGLLISYGGTVTERKLTAITVRRRSRLQPLFWDWT
jgi:hypothetical protein